MIKTTTRKMVAPDGGWGWVIVTAHGLNFLLIFSVLQTFGLIYKNEFVKLGFTGTQSSLIMTTNGGLSMLCGLINGYLLKKFSVRKIALSSGILIVSGLIMTAFSTTFIQFLISYGIIAAIGIGMAFSSYALALNTYFEKQRSKATGFAVTISGLGVIAFPQFASYLLANYTIRDAMLIVSAIFGHTFVSASLLQPVEWHRKLVDNTCEEEPNENKKLFEEETVKVKEILETNTIATCNDTSSLHASMMSLNIHSNKLNEGNVTKQMSEETGTTMNILSIIAKSFDLSLLKDFEFVSLLIGLSTEYFSDFNFMWLIPFVLIETGLSVDQSAIFMSLYSIADLCFKFLAPFIASALKQASRTMLLGALIMVVSVRLFLAFVQDYMVLLVLAVAIGSFRGLRLIYWQLVIPEYVPVERLAGAFGLLFTLNGVCMIAGGPILGIMRDKTGNYKSCVILLNCITVVTIAMWTILIIYKRISSRRKLQSGDICD